MYQVASEQKFRMVGAKRFIPKDDHKSYPGAHVRFVVRERRPRGLIIVLAVRVQGTHSLLEIAGPLDTGRWVLLSIAV